MAAKIIISDIHRVKVKDLKLYGKNPRRGNVQAIQESLEENGMYRPLIVRQDTMEVLAGNHTLAAVKRLKWPEVAVTYVNVDDTQAARIVLADNKTNDLAGYDDRLLAELLQTIPDPIRGTGYLQHEVDRLTQQLLEMAEQQDEQFGHILNSSTGELGEYDHGRAANMPFTPSEDDDPGRKTAEEGSIEAASADLPQSLVQLKDEVFFESKLPWGIPPLRKDMLADIPKPIDTWAGKNVTPDDGRTHWFYNYGVDSPTGLPWDRTILAFYTYDHFFENWWAEPSYYTTKALNAGVKLALPCDFSFWTDDPRVLHLYNLYRARWMGRYFQEAGIKIIPNANWADPDSFDYCLMGIPKGAPAISVCLQTVDGKNREEMEFQYFGLKTALERLEPKSLLVYTGGTGKKTLERVQPTQYCPTTVIDNRAAKRRGKVFGIERDLKKDDGPQPSKTAAKRIKIRKDKELVES